jgi:hypothetical protein
MDVVLFALLLFMLITASSMFKFHMLVVTIVMLNILKLIMKIIPNYPTHNLCPLEMRRILWTLLSFRQAPTYRIQKKNERERLFFLFPQ